MKDQGGLWSELKEIGMEWVLMVFEKALAAVTGGALVVVEVEEEEEEEKLVVVVEGAAEENRVSL